jgi:hypothetical protein
MGIWSTITGFIEAVKALVSLWNWFRNMQEKQAEADAQRRKQELDSALEQLKVAKTESELYEAQTRISRSRG